MKKGARQQRLIPDSDPIPRNAVFFRPVYEELPEKPKTDFRLRVYQEALAKAKKNNLSIFFNALGECTYSPSDYQGRELRDLNPNDYLREETNGFSSNPDSVIVYDGGVMYLESKASLTKSSKYWIPLRQLKRHTQLLLERIDIGDQTPGVDYLLFTYGQRRAGYDSYHCDRNGKIRNGRRHHCDNHCLTKNLTQDVKSEVIIPLALVFALLKSPLLRVETSFDQTTSLCEYDSAYEFQISTRVSTVLNGGITNGHVPVEPISSIEELLGDNFDRELSRFLRLEDLRIRRFQSPTLVCRPKGIYKDFPTKGFPITKVEMTEEGQKQFLDNLQSAYDWLFQAKLGLGELYDTSFDPSQFVEREF